MRGGRNRKNRQGELQRKLKDSPVIYLLNEIARAIDIYHDWNVSDADKPRKMRDTLAFAFHAVQRMPRYEVAAMNGRRYENGEDAVADFTGTELYKSLPWYKRRIGLPLLGMFANWIYSK